MCTWVEEFLMGHQVIASSPPRLVFKPHFSRIVVKEKDSGLSCTKTVGGGKQANASAKHFRSIKFLCLSRMSMRSQKCHKDEENLATLSFMNNNGFVTVGLFCLKALLH